MRQLKQHLSQYLDRAARGEVITVTERGRPKLLLVPLLGGGDRLVEGIEDGWITAARRPGTLAPARRTPGISPVTDVLDDDRGD